MNRQNKYIDMRIIDYRARFTIEWILYHQIISIMLGNGRVHVKGKQGNVIRNFSTLSADSPLLFGFPCIKHHVHCLQSQCKRNVKYSQFWLSHYCDGQCDRDWEVIGWCWHRMNFRTTAIVVVLDNAMHMTISNDSANIEHGSMERSNLVGCVVLSHKHRLNAYSRQRQASKACKNGMRRQQKHKQIELNHTFCCYAIKKH